MAKMSCSVQKSQTAQNRSREQQASAIPVPPRQRLMIILMTGYVLKGGKPGYDRLQLLARDRWADTRALLKRAGISAGMRWSRRYRRP